MQQQNQTVFHWKQGSQAAETETMLTFSLLECKNMNTWAILCHFVFLYLNTDLEHTFFSSFFLSPLLFFLFTVKMQVGHYSIMPMPENMCSKVAGI